MSFTPKHIQEAIARRSYAFNAWQQRALLGMFAMVLLTFAAGNLWALLWQASDWLTATILPAVVVDLTNDERLAANARPLARNALLDEAARQKAEHMAAESYFAHYSPDGVSPWHWFREVDYQFAHAGENLAVHFTDSRAVVQAWMNSPSHRENIENSVFTEIGVGTARGRYNGHDTIFVVQMFGTPAAPTVAAATTQAPPTPPEPVPDVVLEEESEEISTSSVEASADSVGDLALVTEADAVPSETAPEDEAPEAQAIGGAGADPVEVLEDRAVELVATETADTATDTIDAATQTATTSTTSLPYVAQSSDGLETESKVVDYWFTTTHATSSGLPVATTAGTTAAGFDRLNPFVAMSTQPGAVVQFVYSVLGLLTAGMIVWALQLELRRHRYVQAVYSIGLLGLMGGLWYVHELVTSGAVIT